MDEAKKRKVYAPEFKATVGLELERLKKAVRDQPVMTRRTWIDPQDEVSIVRQCALAGVSRTTFYATRKPRPVDADELVLKRLINEEYARNPLYVSRTMVVFLKAAGHIVNRKRVQRLMQESGLTRDVAGSRCNVAGMEGE